MWRENVIFLPSTPPSPQTKTPKKEQVIESHWSDKRKCLTKPLLVKIWQNTNSIYIAS